MEANGSEGGCAYGFVSRGHTACSPANNESSHRGARVGPLWELTYTPPMMAAVMKYNQHIGGATEGSEGGHRRATWGQLVMHDLSLAHRKGPSPTRYG